MILTVCDSWIYFFNKSNTSSIPWSDRARRNSSLHYYIFLSLAAVTRPKWGKSLSFHSDYISLIHTHRHIRIFFSPIDCLKISYPKWLRVYRVQCYDSATSVFGGNITTDRTHHPLFNTWRSGVPCRHCTRLACSSALSDICTDSSYGNFCRLLKTHLCHCSFYS